MNQGIRSKLDRITNILFSGGVTNPVTYIEQISYLIFLKLLDEKEDDRALATRLGGGGNDLLFPGQAERYRWQKWRFKSGRELRDFVRDDVFPYMGSLARDAPQVAEYFRDAVLEIVDPNVLKQVVDEIDTIAFSRLGPDVKGDIYEYLLTYLGRIDSKTLGQFRTPRQIRAFMVEMLDPDMADTIYDPACGTGGFLVDCVDYLLAKYSAEPTELPIYGEEWLSERDLTIEAAKEQNPRLQTYKKGAGERIPDWRLLERSIFGLDVSRQMMRISMMNMVLHGVENAHLKRANALSEMGGLTEDDLKRRYDVILANPPFAGALPKESVRSDLPTTSRKSELLFLALMMKSLAPGGRCAVVVPEGAVFGSTRAHTELRQKLCTEFEVRAVISLPAGMFRPYAGVKTSVLVFRRPVSPPENGTSASGRVWFYNITNDGYDPDRIQSNGRPETPEQNDIPEMLKAWHAYRDSGFKKPPGDDASAVIAAGGEEPVCWWADIDTICAMGFNLSAKRYRPRVVQETPKDNPVDLIEGLLGLERELASGLEALLADVREAGQ